MTPVNITYSPHHNGFISENDLTFFVKLDNPYIGMPEDFETENDCWAWYLDHYYGEMIY